MSIFGRAGCFFNRHTPDRRHVKWNGRDYVGACQHCGVAIERVARRKWRKRIESGQPQDSASA